MPSWRSQRAVQRPSERVGTLRRDLDVEIAKFAIFANFAATVVDAGRARSLTARLSGL